MAAIGSNIRILRREIVLIALLLQGKLSDVVQNFTIFQGIVATLLKHSYFFGIKQELTKRDPWNI